jgi:type IV secretory pathway VirB9-like protein
MHMTRGGPGGATPILTVKPRTDEVTSTNLFITTNRRIYEVLLTTEAPPEGESTGILEFYYPDDIRRWKAQGKAKRPSGAAWQEPAGGPRPAFQQVSVRGFPATGGAQQAGSRPPQIDAGAMSFRYDWERDAGFPWEPEAVFDDGARVYVKLPRSAEHLETAALFVTGPGGGSTLLNYSVRGNVVVTDRLFDEAHFALAGADRRTGEKEDEIRLRLRRIR